jgi:hypothetical protein
VRADIAAALLLVGLVQQPVPMPAPRSGPDAPVNDPVTVRGCLEGRFLRILEQDSTDLSGLRGIRLKGPRGVMRMLDDHEHAYVELSGSLDLGRRDRIDMRRKVKVGAKTTISVGSAQEQITGQPVVADPVLQVVALTPLGERCPGH